MSTTAPLGARAIVAAAAACVLLAGCSTSVSGTAAVEITSPTPKTTVPTTPTPTAATPTQTPTPALTFTELYSRERSGVVRIETIGCSDAGIGTGFEIAPNLVATVAHVVDRSVVVSLIVGARRTTGTVIGIDRVHDLALVRSAESLRGFRFQFHPSLPEVGDPVAAMGFPIGDPITLTQGHISGLQRRIAVDGVFRNDLIETDTAINPGNSGGPLLGADGSVVGLIDATRADATGIGYAVPATIASARDAQWSAAPQSVPSASCANPLGPPQASASVPTPDQIDALSAEGIVAAFTTYFQGINTGNYATAWAVLSPRVRGTLDSFAAGDATSYDSDVTVLDATRVDGDTVQVALSFTSLQRADKAPSHSGDTCDIWTLVYTMVQASDRSWLIDGTKPYHGTTFTRC